MLSLVWISNPIDYLKIVSKNLHDYALAIKPQLSTQATGIKVNQYALNQSDEGHALLNTWLRMGLSLRQDNVFYRPINLSPDTINYHSDPNTYIVISNLDGDALDLVIEGYRYLVPRFSIIGFSGNFRHCVKNPKSCNRIITFCSEKKLRCDFPHGVHFLSVDKPTLSKL